MKRRQVLAGIGSIGLALVEPARVWGQPGRIRRIGYLASSDPTKTPQLEGLRKGLREHGLIEGRNVTIEYLWRDGALATDAAAPLVRLNVELIFVWGTPALAAAQRATKRIPIVFVGVGDPIGAGFVKSFARPGGNITGVTNNARELAAKRLELLAQVVPAGSKVIFLRNPANALSTLELKELEPAAARLGLALVTVDVRGAEDLDDAFARAANTDAAGAVLAAEPVFFTERQRMAALERRHRLPCIQFSSETMQAGCFMSYGVNSTETFRRGARYVALILRGSEPGDLPVEQATQFELWVNMTAAKEIGVKVPPTLLQRADRVIE